MGTQQRKARRTAKAIGITVAVAAIGGLALASTGAAQGDARRSDGYYASKTPYEPQQDVRTYQSAPAGFVPVFTETASRHGSRTPDNGKDADLLVRLWTTAEGEGALTPGGRSFGPQVQSMLTAMRKVGFGNETGRGKRELQGTARRLDKRLPGLFARIAAHHEPIGVVIANSTGRVADSARFFTTALADTDPAAKPLISPARTDPDLLYFHKSAGGAAYRDYIAHDKRLAATLKKIVDQPATHQAARHVLERIFTKSFVARISAGEFSSIGTDVEAAKAVYNLYSIAPDMRVEGTWHMDRYIDPKDASWFAYLADAEEFYKKGPGFADSDITYKMANVLLDDFFKQVEAEQAGSDLGADLRFTHAEEIMPLAALMRLPGSTEAASPAHPYTYADNPWRGGSVSPMAANIQWDVFRKGKTYLVRMLYNERETAFKQGCKPVSKGSVFYDFDELERCFGRKPA